MERNCQLFFDFNTQQNLSFKTILSTPHLNLSAHTFAVYTLPFDRISSILDLLASDEAATHDLLVLDWINQTIVNLEWQLNKNHRLAAQRLSTLLWHWIAQQLPQQIHNAQQLDCGHCQLCHWKPTSFWQPSQPVSSLSSSSSSSSSSARSRYCQMSPYPRPSNPIPLTSTSTTAPLPFPPLTTHSGQVYPCTYFEANAADCLCHLQTILEERQWGTVNEGCD